MKAVEGLSAAIVLLSSGPVLAFLPAPPTPPWQFYLAKELAADFPYRPQGYAHSMAPDVKVYSNGRLEAGGADELLKNYALQRNERGPFKVAKSLVQSYAGDYRFIQVVAYTLTYLEDQSVAPFDNWGETDVFELNASNMVVRIDRFTFSHDLPLNG